MTSDTPFTALEEIQEAFFWAAAPPIPSVDTAVPLPEGGTATVVGYVLEEANAAPRRWLNLQVRTEEGMLRILPAQALDQGLGASTEPVRIALSALGTVRARLARGFSLEAGTDQLLAGGVPFASLAFLGPVISTLLGGEGKYLLRPGPGALEGLRHAWPELELAVVGDTLIWAHSPLLAELSPDTLRRIQPILQQGGAQPGRQLLRVAGEERVLQVMRTAFGLSLSSTPSPS